MWIWEKTEYHTLQLAIESSNSEEWVENSVYWAYKEWYELLKSSKTYPDLHKKFTKEYEDLRSSILSALSDDRIFTQSELLKIKLELNNLQVLAEANWLTPKKNVWSKIWDTFHGAKSWEIANKISLDLTKIKEKNIGDYSIDEQKWILEYLNSNYWSFTWDSNDYMNKWFSYLKEKVWLITTLWSLESKRDVNIFQIELIKKIYWDTIITNWFKWENIHWFNWSEINSKWNYVISSTVFESILWANDIRDINSLALSNYIKLLHSKWNATPEYLLEKFWKDNLEKLSELWSKNKDSIVQTQLKNVWLENIIEIIKLFSTPQEFIKWVENLWKNSKLSSLALKYLQKNKEELTKKFSWFIKDSINKDFPNKSEKEKEDILKKIIWEFKEVKNETDLTKIAETIAKVKTKYSLKSFAEKEVALHITEANRNENELQWTEASIKKAQAEIKLREFQSLWDKEWVNKQTQIIIQANEAILLSQQNEIKLAKVNLIVENIWDKDLQEIWTGFKKVSDIVEELKKKDATFAEKYNNYNKIENDLWKNTITNKSNKDLEKTKTEKETIQTETLTYSTGTTIEYSQTSSGYALKTEIWDIQITPEEFKIIGKSKEAVKNLIDFKTTLDKLGLSWLWQYREQIFKAISNTPTSWFKIDNNYIDTNELRIFLVSILSSIGVNVNNPNNLEDIKLKVLEENKYNVEKDKSGKSNVEQKFVEKFDTKRTGKIDFASFSQSL